MGPASGTGARGTSSIAVALGALTGVLVGVGVPSASVTDGRFDRPPLSLPTPDAITPATRLPLAARATISRVLGRDDSDYHAARSPGGFRAENEQHGLRLDFRRDSVLVHAGRSYVGLALERIGYGDSLRAVQAAAPRADRNRVEYRRGTLTEWYLNGPFGLEQGFTLARRPEGAPGAPLTLGLRVAGTLRASPARGSGAVTFSSAVRPDTLRYGGLAAFDSSGRALRAWFDLEGPMLLLRVDDARARYPVVIDPFVEQVHLVASQRAHDQFGFGVAVDGATIVVGAPFENVGANQDQGAAYVFVKEQQDGWKEEARLIASDGRAGHAFGTSVAFHDRTVVVGAPTGVLASEQGSAYVFVQPQNGWRSGPQCKDDPAKVCLKETKQLLVPGTAGERLGVSVAVKGSTVVLGAPVADVKERDQGAAYVFADWQSEAPPGKLTVPDGAAGDQLGASVAVVVAGETVVVGAPFADVEGNKDQGSAYVFAKRVTGWTKTATLTQAAVDEGESLADAKLGSSVAADGDTIVAGAPEAGLPGAAYVFVRSGTEWASGNQTARLEVNDEDTFGLGSSIAMRTETVVVGAPEFNATHPADSTGAAYVFVRPSGGWAEGDPCEGNENKVCIGPTTQLLASDASAGALDMLGFAVATDGATAVAGVPFDDLGDAEDQLVGNEDEGSVYAFVKPADGGWGSEPVTRETAKLTPSDPRTEDDRLGYAVAVADGVVVVGAPRADVGENRWQGAAYVFFEGREGWPSVGVNYDTEMVKLTVSDGKPFDRFGRSVAVDGETVVVGAAYADIGDKPDQGAAYVFAGIGEDRTEMTETTTLTAKEGAARDGFGDAVAVRGKRVVVGAPRADATSGGNQGAAYVFVEPADGWKNRRETETQKLTASDAKENDWFGYSVAVDGRTVVVGAPFAAVRGRAQAGSAYIFLGERSWIETAKLTAVGGARFDWLGYSVAVDEGTVVTGAPRAGDRRGVGDEGAAYVFLRPEDGWESGPPCDDGSGRVCPFQTAQLNAFEGAENNFVGASVALVTLDDAGDVVVVGGPFVDVEGNENQGAAYLYVEPEGGWAGGPPFCEGNFSKCLTETEAFYASNGRARDSFGFSVAIDGETILVGAPEADFEPNANQGSAYVFEPNNSS